MAINLHHGCQAKIAELEGTVAAQATEIEELKVEIERLNSLLAKQKDFCNTFEAQQKEYCDAAVGFCFTSCAANSGSVQLLRDVVLRIIAGDNFDEQSCDMVVEFRSKRLRMRHVTRSQRFRLSWRRR